MVVGAFRVGKLIPIGSWQIHPTTIYGIARKRAVKSQNALNGRVERVAVVTDGLCGQYQLFF